jgi:hypothetical protein
MHAEARISNLNSASNSMDGQDRLTFLCFSDSLSGMPTLAVSQAGVLAICCSV